MSHDIAQFIEFFERQVEGMADQHIGASHRGFEHRRHMPIVQAGRNIGPDHGSLRAALLHAGLQPSNGRFIDQIGAAGQAVKGGNDDDLLSRLHLGAVVEEIVDRHGRLARHYRQ